MVRNRKKKKKGTKKFRMADLKPMLPVLILLFVGIGMRVFGAWATAHSTSSDHSVACLMAKHIAEGVDFPIFYYGQPYMGSIEPTVSAVFCLFGGVSGFAVNLGTAFLGILLLIMIYAWGKGAAGRIAGIAALAYAGIGAPSYFQFMSWSYGGYAALVFLSALLVWSAAWIRQYDVGKVYVQLGSFLLVGFVAGLGWWTSPLIIPAGLAAVILLVPLFRRRHFAGRLITMGLGFVLGGALFWGWNYRHGWATFRHFAAEAHGGEYFPALKSIVGEMLFGLTGFGDVPAALVPLAHILRWMIPLVLILFVYLLWRNLRNDDRRSNTPYLLGAVLLFVLLPLVAAGSARYSGQLANRYLLSAWPALAVMVGVTTAWLVKRWRYGLGWLPLILLVGMQAMSLPVYVGWRKGDTQQFTQIQRFGGFLEEKGIHVVFTPYAAPGGANYSLNFLLNEQFTFPVPGNERYLPYAMIAELSGGVGVLNNHGDISGLLALSGGSSEYNGIPGFNVHYKFEPPARTWREIPREVWLSAADSEEEDVLDVIADNNLATRWHEPGGDNRDRWVEVRFKHPVKLSGLRLTSRDGHYPLKWNLMVYPARGEERKLISDALFIPWYWSGPRPFWTGAGYRMEAEFDPVEVVGLRIAVDGDASEIAELQMFEPSEGNESANPADMNDLTEFFASHETEAVYCERWMANRLLREFDGSIFVSLEPSIFTFQKFALPRCIRLNASTVFVVKKMDAPLCRRVLSQQGVKMDEASVGQWVIFHFAPETWREEYTAVKGLIWNGYACLADIPERVLSDLNPEINAEALFANGARLLGVTISPHEAKPGTSMDVSLFWIYSGEIHPERLNVFVHFKQEGETIFQNDHPFLQQADSALLNGEEVLVETYRLRVPDDALPGDYNLEIGLYDHEPPYKRLSVRSAWATDNRSIRIAASAKR